MKYLYTFFVFSDWMWVASLTKCFCWLKLGRKVDRKRLRIHSNIVGCFCFAENRGMLPSIELLVFVEWIGCNHNRDQQKIVCRNVLSLLLFFRFCGGIKRISALTYDYFGQCSCFTALYSTNWSCWWIMHVTDIVVSWRLGSNCIVLYRNRLMLCLWVSSLFAEIYLHCLLSWYKHIRSRSNKFRKC